MKVLYEDNHVLVVEKPCNVVVQADNTQDADMLTLCKAYLKEKYNKPGNVYLGLVHRLDRPVGGVMVFAKTSKAASRLSDAIRKHEVVKEYVAVLDGTLPKQEDRLLDYLEKDHRTNMVKVTDEKHGKFSALHYETLAVKNNQTLVHIYLETGRPHQIRVQFSSRKAPLLNDQRYHPHPAKGQIALWAVRLTFPHPTTKENITITDLPGKEGNWNGFQVKL